MSENNCAPEIQVGVFSGEEIRFTLNANYRENKSGLSLFGMYIGYLTNEKILLKNDEGVLELEAPVLITPLNIKDSSFTLHAVTIGVNFHWQRKEDQIFKGSLKLIVENNKLTAINILSIEDYLTSVISSEMRATSSEEFLKAHAVISRSWLLAQINKSSDLKTKGRGYSTSTSTDDEIIRWYDREDHKHYDVCADDHCQRYQGITRASTPTVEKVIKETYGEVLTFNSTICDTRYYKCCGGITELFENTWEPVNHPYIQSTFDNPESHAGFEAGIMDEATAEKWILGNPDAFCNTSDKKVLSQVLNDYDQETNDFFRWRVTYTQEELSNLIRIRTGIDFGTVIDLIPLERGSSGRIIKLRIVGTLITMTIGKELEIRKSLSKSHLYSSCFIVEKTKGAEGTSFILHGAGWGHGVGLCQIGAAMMGVQGYKYREILMHYFSNAKLEKIYSKDID